VYSSVLKAPVGRSFDADSEYLKFVHLNTLEYVEVQNTGLMAMAGQTQVQGGGPPICPHVKELHCDCRATVLKTQTSINTLG
jgi:hypothetical protein